MNVHQLVECSDITIRAGRRAVVEGFSWTHATGGIAWLVGSNGSGKSSLLRALAGWQRPHRGTVRWTGTPGQRVRYAAPKMNGSPDLSVADFLDFVSAFHKDSMVGAELDALYPSSVEPYKRFRHLSTGEAKRLLLWAMLKFQDGSPLVLDEPYEHLSRDAKHSLTTLLQDAADRCVVIIATNQDVPERRIDTVLTIDNAFIEIERAVKLG